MPLFLDTRSKTILSVAICDRCGMKRPYVDLSADRNNPGLRVCNKNCNDEFDPWRLPARSPDKIAIRYARPDNYPEMPEPLTLITEETSAFQIFVENSSIPEANGNLDVLEL
jgi:hypothetical protein